jgi:hypothetical protein
MARYIDADKLCEALKSMASVQPTFKQSTIFGVVSSIENFPTADVVPKSEVEELKAIIADHKASEERWEELYSNTKTEVAREIFNDLAIMFTLHRGFNENHIVAHIDFEALKELKKKYTEGKKDEN